MYKFTQSALKDLERQDNCPTKWKGLYVDRSWKRTPSKAMLKGSYFEQLWLGAGATEEKVIDLPRLKNGRKSKDQIRIEEQAERAKQLFDANSPSFLGFEIKQVQVKLEGEDKEGTADIWAVDKEGESWLIDAKLTEDLTNTWGDYAWGKPYDELDLVQLPHYQDLFNDIYGHRPRMALFICDYSPQKRIEFNEIVVSEDRRKTKDFRFDTARKQYNKFIEDGFPVNPSKKECSDCPLKCDMRYIDNDNKNENN